MSPGMSRIAYSGWLVGWGMVVIGAGIYGFRDPSPRVGTSRQASQLVQDVNDMALPAPADVQQLLNRLDPADRIKEDGRIGPETLKKWNRVYCEISAREAFESLK